ncbi:MAG: methyltransferase domain-containing protein [archaeon]|nr:MAG: methyltransferase domain-containing protein [archaeon]
MTTRRPGLQRKWSHVVNSLQRVVPSYELASSRIALFGDGKMRRAVADFLTGSEGAILDLGSGPGTMAKALRKARLAVVLLDISRPMLKASGSPDSVQGLFEHLPFRDSSFAGAASSYAIRDSRDLPAALSELARVVRPGGRVGVCDLGKPDSPVKGLLVAAYLRTVPSVLGLVTAGRQGLAYGSLFDTYVLTLPNSSLLAAFSRHFGGVTIAEPNLGASIVLTATRPR